MTNVVSQIFISDDNGPLPPLLESMTLSVRTSFSSALYNLYDKKLLRKFITENFQPDVLIAYEKLRPYSSKPGNPIFENAISRVIKNCREGFYGMSPLCPTGPTLIGQSIAKYGSNPRI